MVRDGDSYYQWIFTIAPPPPGATIEGTFDVGTVAKALIGPGSMHVSVDAVGPGGLPLDNTENTTIDLVVSR